MIDRFNNLALQAVREIDASLITGDDAPTSVLPRPDCVAIKVARGREGEFIIGGSKFFSN
jgi:hypothetical protein